MHHADGRVVSNFIVQALQGVPITVFGEGNQTRSFCYVDDLVVGFLRFMDTSNEITGPVNLGNPVEFTILELAQKVIEMTGSNSEITYKQIPQDDPKQGQPDISKACKLLGWEPEIQLESGLKKTVDYFRSVLPELAAG